MLRIAFTRLLHVANVYRSVFLFTFTLNLFRDNTLSPYQDCTFLAPCLHQPCTKSARQSCGLCSKHAGFTHHQPAESGVALPALERTKSEGRANKERRNASEPVPGDPESGCRQLSENPGSCHKTKGLRNKNTHSPAVTKLFSIYFAAIQHLLFKLQVPNISSFLFEYVFHRTSDPHLRSFQIENVGNGCGYIELHHALLNPTFQYPLSLR